MMRATIAPKVEVNGSSAKGISLLPEGRKYSLFDASQVEEWRSECSWGLLH